MAAHPPYALDVASLLEHVDVDRLVSLTSALVAVDTRNPPGNEAPIEEVVRSALDARTSHWRSIEPAPGRLSLVAELDHPAGPDPRRPTLIVNGHLDVVPVNAGAWSHDPFDPQVVDGRLYGRGTADMKGGIAAAICALDVLERAGRVPGCNLVFHLVADEERGGRLGTLALLEAGMIQGDACLVPEPTDLELCVAERGLLQARLHIAGRPGHGSRPREGVSAIEHAARVVLALHAADFGGDEHPLLGRPTANVGTISGGSAFNTVAESCVVGVDRRVLPGATAESTQAEIEALIEAAGVEGLRYQFELDTFGEASEMSAGDPWVKLVGDAVAAATGRPPGVIGMTFTTDARFVRNQAGIPAVVCGPGRIDQAHGDDEYVEVSSLAQAAAAFAELFASYA
ncbi:MAG: M20 family metallopeptidase [Acidobacteriota bacterium]|nr:M20 family metallopeptidase [Acidobacteriota bacterium]